MFVTRQPIPRRAVAFYPPVTYVCRVGNREEETIMMRKPGQVVIVGAGPAGMALAYLLARRGVGVTVLEMHHDFARAFRGEGLQRSGIDAFRQMGLGEQFDRLPHTELHFIEIYSRGRRVLRADAERFGRGQVRAVS